MASITDAGGVADISRWCKPPVPTTKCGKPRQGRRNGHRAISAAPAGARIQSSRRTGGLHHRLMSNVPSGQSRLFEVEDYAEQILARDVKRNGAKSASIAGAGGTHYPPTENNCAASR